MTVRILAAVALAATLVVNFLANALPIAGRTTGEVSDSFPVFSCLPGTCLPSGV